MKRSSGILLPVSALPSNFGIGTIGKSAYDFIDFLSRAGQTYWQVLPMGPTSFGDSPYQPFSTFAGNPYFIDLDELRKDGLLKKSEIEAMDWGDNPEKIRYDKIYSARYDVLQKAFSRGYRRDEAEVCAFIDENSAWIKNYALFMAVKRRFNMASWDVWEDEKIKTHDEAAVEEYSRELSDDVHFFEYVQFLFFKQWKKLREYAKSRGIKILGDLPIYVAMDSADVWAEQENFQISENGEPKAVAGVPPDYFCEEGQLWGNPLYNWDKMREDGYGWWIRRVDGALKMFDTIRIDHFRGFESYWSVPFGDKTAENGKWVKGPGIEFINALKGWFPNLSVIAEDLGILTDEVHELRKASGFPGMKVLEFAFEAGSDSTYLPHKYERNCVCYTGTHDNDTLAGWLKAEKKKNITFAAKYLGLNSREGRRWGVIRGGMCSNAALFVAQMQDYLGTGSESRINTPGTMGENWCWRMEKGVCSRKLAKKIREYTEMYGRLNDGQEE